MNAVYLHFITVFDTVAQKTSVRWSSEEKLYIYIYSKNLAHSIQTPLKKALQGWREVIRRILLNVRTSLI